MVILSKENIWYLLSIAIIVILILAVVAFFKPFTLGCPQPICPEPECNCPEECRLSEEDKNEIINEILEHLPKECNVTQTTSILYKPTPEEPDLIKIALTIVLGICSAITTIFGKKRNWPVVVVGLIAFVICMSIAYYYQLYSLLVFGVVVLIIAIITAILTE